jgi:hypothetical protein
MGIFYSGEYHIGSLIYHRNRQLSQKRRHYRLTRIHHPRAETAPQPEISIFKKDFVSEIVLLN